MTAAADPDRAQVAAFWRRAADDLGLDPSIPVEGFPFGDSADMADRLAAAISSGPKRATAGLLADLEAGDEPVPHAGMLWIVTDGAGAPQALVRTTAVATAPFAAADAAFAWDEGEGPRSLPWWREVHERFFRRRCPGVGLTWSPDLPVLFERFDVLWPAPAARRLVLRRPATDAEWDAYHRLRRVELFEAHLPDHVYDPDHPPLWRPEVFHLGLFSAGALLGCIQVEWAPEDGWAALRMVAVDPGIRGTGVGRELLRRAEAFAWVNGRRRARVFADPGAVGYYRALGYVDSDGWGEESTGAGSLPMTADLDGALLEAGIAAGWTFGRTHPPDATVPAAPGPVTRP